MGSTRKSLLIFAIAAAWVFSSQAMAGTDCGNGTCDAGEDFCNCSDDCDDPNPSACDPCECGSFSLDCACDDLCVAIGDCCANACGACGFCSFCGDGTCGDDEDSCTCPEDCVRTTCTPCDCDVSTPAPFPSCYCDDACVANNDCCANACDVCGKCPLPPTGACCLGGDTCSDGGFQSECEANGGVYQGDDTICDPNPCIPPTGACCLSTGCSDGGAQSECEANSGVYQGDGSLCSSVNCHAPGACCFGDNTCEVISAGACGEAFYVGDGTTCDACGPIGACCFVNANGDEDCAEFFAIICSGGLLGTPQGEGTVCESDTCADPTGACCLLNGDCTPASATDCIELDGVYQGDGTSCEPNTCPQPGACCFDAKGTPSCSEVVESVCQGFAGEFQGEGTACDPDPCVEPIGACCLVGGAAAGSNVAGPVPAGCVEVTAESCAGVGGQYLGDDSTCDVDSCVTGACCVTPPIPVPVPAFCVEDSIPGNCTIFATFHEGLSCADIECGPPTGACCIAVGGFNIAGGTIPVGCSIMNEFECVSIFGGQFFGEGTTCEANPCNPERVDISTKGSLLIFSDVELEWTQGPIAGPAGFNVTKDTVISLTNDYPGEVYVQMYFINGDPERDAIFSGGPLPVLISEQEPGCNWVDCAVLLTPDQSVYWSAVSGNPVGCQPFGILDPDLGNGPGRPNPDVLGGPRVLRGYIVAWAVDANGHQINWNHLSGKATIVDYAAHAAWEYSPWAFQAMFFNDNFGANGFSVLALDGIMYENAFDMLLFDFFASGSMALSSNGNAVSVDTDLTLHPVSHDLRQEHEPPVTTKAHFDIWNMNERKLSNTRRCITCWDQVLLSQFNAPNSFLLMNLQSDKGKARIDGKQADECEENCFRDMEPDAIDGNQTAGFLGDLLDLDFVCSQDAALLGVAAKILRFGNNSIDYAGSELVGMGTEPAFILYDIVGPPGTLREDTYSRIRPTPSKPTRIDGSNRGK